VDPCRSLLTRWSLRFVPHLSACMATHARRQGLAPPVDGQGSTEASSQAIVYMRLTSELQ
jgi:hypothetical protein